MTDSFTYPYSQTVVTLPSGTVAIDMAEVAIRAMDLNRDVPDQKERRQQFIAYFETEYKTKLRDGEADWLMDRLCAEYAVSKKKLWEEVGLPPSTPESTPGT